MERRGFRFRFSLRTLFVFMLGIAVGFSLNLEALKLFFAPASEARKSVLNDYVIEPPDVLQIDARGEFSPAFPSVAGKHLVGPDGNIYLGAFGPVNVSGLTLEEAQSAIKDVLEEHVKTTRIALDIAAYNSKKYYVITQNPGSSRVLEAPVTGNETVLDALARTGNKWDPSTTKITLSRPSTNGIGPGKNFPIDWQAITSGASATDNYQLWPGDRVFISQKAAPVKN